MSTDLISGNSADLLTIDPVSKAAHVTVYNTAGAVVTPLVAADLTSGTQRAQPFDVQLNQTALITMLRHPAVGVINRVYGDSFSDGIGAGDGDAGAFPTTVTVTGSATGGVAGGSLNIRTGATVGSTASFFSTMAMAFITGSTCNLQHGVTVSAGNMTALRFVSRKTGVNTIVESSAFNVVPTPITNAGTPSSLAGALVDGNNHRFDIFYQGNAAILAVDGVVVHRMSGSTPSPRTDTLSLPTGYEALHDTGAIGSLRFGQYSATDGYFVEVFYNIGDVEMKIRGTTSSRIGATRRVQKVSEGFDSLRVRVIIKFEAVAPATADTLLTLVKQVNGVDAAGATSIGVTANKALRITGGHIVLKTNAAAQAFGTMTLRQNPTGATVLGSASWSRVDTGLTTAVINDAKAVHLSFAEGQEFTGIQTLGISLSAQAVTNIVSIALHGYEYSIGA